MSQSALSDMLSNLRKLKYLEYDAESRRYFPSSEIHRLFGWLRVVPLKSPGLKSLLDQLSDEAEEMAFVSRRVHLFASLIYGKQPKKPMAVKPVPGMIGARRRDTDGGLRGRAQQQQKGFDLIGSMAARSTTGIYLNFVAKLSEHPGPATRQSLTVAPLISCFIWGATSAPSCHPRA